MRSTPVIGGAAVLLLLAPLAACQAEQSNVGSDQEESPTAALEALEEEFDATLGVYAIDTGSGDEVAHNAKERFGYASTFKALLAGAILEEYTVDGLDEVVEYTEDDLVDHSPETEQHVADGMTLEELCDAAVRQSDNAATNLLLEKLDGPHGLDAILEDLGDDVTQMERIEPAMSEVKEGDTRDTSTPQAFTQNLEKYVLGDVLADPEREQLTEWLRTNETGDTLIAAGLPDDWEIGDKSGQGSTHGIRNNIAVIWPPDDADPIVAAVMSKRPDVDAESDDALIAQAGEIIAAQLG